MLHLEVPLAILQKKKKSVWSTPPLRCLLSLHLHLYLFGATVTAGLAESSMTPLYAAPGSLKGIYLFMYFTTILDTYNWPVKYTSNIVT